MSEMNCPKCSTALSAEEGPLSKRSCPSCQGAWFDVLRLESLPQRVAQAHEIVTAYSHIASQEHEAAGMTCPACGKGLVRAEYARVEVDACNGCKGLWFDRFELEGVLDPATTRPCPKCEAPMRHAKWRDVPVDECRGCNGHWLDVALMESQPDVGRESEEALDALIAAFAVPGDEPTKATEYSCPICRKALEAAVRQGVELDFCFHCRGLYLDAGEMEQVTKLDAPALQKAGQATLDRLLGLIRKLQP